MKPSTIIVIGFLIVLVSFLSFLVCSRWSHAPKIVKDVSLMNGILWSIVGFITMIVGYWEGGHRAVAEIFSRLGFL